VLLPGDNVVWRDEIDRRPSDYRVPMGNPHESVNAGCGLCGIPVPDSAVTWMVERTPRGTVRTCPACARANLRAIESKLEQEYW
jgi:hypothetical protein